MKKLCHCGQPLHYTDPDLERTMNWIVERQGELVTVTLEDEQYLVPRHYIALHGLRADQLPFLGFQKVEKPGFDLKNSQN